MLGCTQGSPAAEAPASSRAASSSACVRMVVAAVRRRAVAVGGRPGEGAGVVRRLQQVRSAAGSSTDATIRLPAVASLRFWECA